LETEQTVDASAKAKVTFEKGSSTIAYVFNNDKKLVLAGFITDSTNVISPATYQVRQTVSQKWLLL